MICEYCNKEFKTKSSLNLHKKTAKYCISQRSEIDQVNTCTRYDKLLATQQELELVNKKLENTEQELLHKTHAYTILEQELHLSNSKLTDSLCREQKLWDEYKELASISAKKETNINNNINHIKKDNINITNNNLQFLTPFNLTQENITQTVNDHFTVEHFNKGQKGVAQFTYEQLLKDEDGNLMYICTDNSRQISKYKNEFGVIEKDVKANKLTKMIYDDVIAKSNQIKDGRLIATDDIDIIHVIHKHNIDIHKLKRDNSEFRTELAMLTT